ncbi:MAG: hypothetical protein AABY32_01275 [Nanoarchaeota archaeon]
MNEKNYLVQYVRGSHGRKVGVVVATIKDGLFWFGWSLCNEKDEFNRKIAYDIAYGRANKYSNPVEKYDSGQFSNLPNSVKKTVKKIYSRCVAYFKQPVNTGKE